MHARVKDMNANGVWSSMNFSTFVQFPGTLFAVFAHRDPEQATELRRGDPGKLEALALQTMARHVRAMLQLREQGAVVFDYGNNIRPHAAGAGVTDALDIDIFTARYLRPLFSRGIGPFRWICVSGEDDDLDAIAQRHQREK